jgi:23S rRNA (adenine2503-C2)-methyltransferase
VRRCSNLFNACTPKSPKTVQKTELLGLSLEELKVVLAEKLESNQSYRAKQIYTWLYAKRATSFRQMTNLPKELLDKLVAKCSIGRLKIAHESTSVDGTKKFLFHLQDGLSIETVLIPSEMRNEQGELRRRTLCVSTQVGCPLDCKFCATGTLKLKRNLTTAEILLQIFEVERHTGETITNLVYMGMGEPMLNYENVVASLRIITDPEVNLLNKRRVTVSTSGLPEAIRRFAHEGLHVKLAISLHATTDDLRTQLMPINKRYPIADILSSVDEFYRETKIPITYEYILFEGLNDSLADAKRLSRIAKRVPSKVNVIPFHPIDFTHPTGIAATLKPTTEEAFDQFLATLKSLGVLVMVRTSSGKDIEAACGQLALAEAMGPGDDGAASPTVPTLISIA